MEPEYTPWTSGAPLSRPLQGDAATANVGNSGAIVPSISGWVRQHGINTIFVDSRDPFSPGFQVA